MKKSIALMTILILTLAAVGAQPYAPMKFGLVGSISPFNVFSMESPLAYAPFSLGGQLHVSERLSAKLTLVFLSNKGTEEDKFTGDPEFVDSEFTSLGAQLDLPYHALRFDTGSFYVGPSVFFLNNSSNSYDLNLGSRYLSSEREDTIMGGGLLIGGQYLPAPNFGVFLDCGVNYIYVTSSRQYFNSSGAVTGEQVDTSSILEFRVATFGLIFYLN